MTRNRVIRRMNRHRDFPEGTCPASRHSAMIATGLIRGDDFVIDPIEYPHAGESIAATVGSLWQARSKLRKLGYEFRNGQWRKVFKKEGKD